MSIGLACAKLASPFTRGRLAPSRTLEALPIARQHSSKQTVAATTSQLQDSKQPDPLRIWAEIYRPAKRRQNTLNLNVMRFANNNGPKKH